jgi:hypothetical protein
MNNPPIFNKTKRLSNDTAYVRPKKTLQDALSNDDIKDKLKEYKKVSDIRKIIIGTHIRYFTKDKQTKKPVFRLGGFLTKFGDEYKYVILSNGTISWSVQNNADTQFWAKMNSKEIVTNLETEKEEETKEIESKYKKLKDKNEYMLKMLEDQKKENEKLAKKLKEIESVTKKNKN